MDNDIVGQREIAELLGVAYSTVQQWRQRKIFPAPDGHVSGTPYWQRSRPLEWAHASRGEPIRTRALEALRELGER